MLNEHDLQEFYEERLREEQARYAKSEENRSALLEEQIDLWQALILNHKKIWGLK